MDVLFSVNLGISLLSTVIGFILISAGIMNRNSLLTATGWIFILVMLPSLFVFVSPYSFMWVYLASRILAVLLGLYIVSFLIWSIKQRGEIKERIQSLDEIEKYIRESYLRGNISEGKAKELLFQIGLQRRLLLEMSRRKSVGELSSVLLEKWLGLKL